MKLTQLTENQVVHCKTEDEATRICNMAHELGWKWFDEDSYKKTYADYYKGNICYHFSKGEFSGVSFYREQGKEIIDSTKIENMKKNVLPKYFIIERDENNPLWDNFKEWFKKQSNEINWVFCNNYYGNDGSKRDNGYTSSDYSIDFYNNPSLITLDFWNQCVNGGNKKQITYPVEAKDMQKVFDIACPSWKKKLAKEFATQMMLGEVCLVSEELKKGMLVASTAEQKSVVESLFKEDLSVDVNSMKLGCFFAPRTEGEYKGKGFALYNGYDWNIVRDNKDQIVLVPTKIPANKKGVKKLLNSIECPLK